MFQFTEGYVDELRYEELLAELRKCTEDDLRVLGILAQRLSAGSSIRRSSRPAKQMREEGIDDTIHFSG